MAVTVFYSGVCGEQFVHTHQQGKVIDAKVCALLYRWIVKVTPENV